MVMDKVETQSNNIEDMDIPENISYDECCLGGDKSVDSCGPTAHREFYRLTNLAIYVCEFL